MFVIALAAFVVNTAGTGSTDTLSVTFTGGGLSSTNLDGVTKFETLKSATNVATGAIVLPNAFFASTVSGTLIFAANTTTVVTLDASAETNASITLTTGGGADVLVASSSTYGDNISSGGGDDSITVGAANLSSTDTINGGDGNDTLTVGAGTTLTDSAFTNVSNIEYFAFGTGTNSLVVGSAFQSAGALTITGGAGDDSITIGSGVT